MINGQTAYLRTIFRTGYFIPSCNKKGTVQLFLETNQYLEIAQPSEINALESMLRAKVTSPSVNVHTYTVRPDEPVYCEKRGDFLGKAQRATPGPIATECKFISDIIAISHHGEPSLSYRNVHQNWEITAGIISVR